MTTIIGIAGSLRSKSYNAALLRAAIELAPQGCTVVIGSIAGIPLYDGDLEVNEGIPAPVTDLKNRIAEADGLLIVTPEYNNSLPGVLKNAIDWLSRPPADIARVFRNRPVAIMGATPGAVGTRLAQTAWLPIIRTLGMRPWFGGQLYVGGASKVFDESGKLVDKDIRERLQKYISSFAEFIEGHRLQ
ncbi:MAG: NADPH-dependent FMN reductase [Gammaproteobacteria bacterium]|nr:MAG: NADPH-dependent FMN reductase [Gammaproteobacteria bacterium]